LANLFKVEFAGANMFDFQDSVYVKLTESVTAVGPDWSYPVKYVELVDKMTLKVTFEDTAYLSETDVSFSVNVKVSKAAPSVESVATCPCSLGFIADTGYSSGFTNEAETTTGSITGPTAGSTTTDFVVTGPTTGSTTTKIVFTGPTAGTTTTDSIVTGPTTGTTTTVLVVTGPATGSTTGFVVTGPTTGTTTPESEDCPIFMIYSNKYYSCICDEVNNFKWDGYGCFCQSEMVSYFFLLTLSDYDFERKFY
jgi:hypothetical protein